VAEDPNFNPRAALSQVSQGDRETKPARAALPWRMWGWISLMVTGVLFVVPVAWFAWERIDAWALANASPAQARAALVRDWSDSQSPDYLEAIVEISLNQSTPDEGAAYAAAKRVVELDPTRGFAWATLAYLESRNAQGRINQAAHGDLTRSMDACPLCDQALIRWRLNFVLAHWDAMPEALRKRAFEHADILRWMGDNSEFLAEMRFKAELEGIPFDAYRAAVDTPARSWDIAPAAQLRGASKPPA
jgi:hypothetical protein